ncbi:Imidazole glycerol phosphate synthase subunit HisF [Dirofilaria immitis]
MWYLFQNRKGMKTGWKRNQKRELRKISQIPYRNQNQNPKELLCSLYEKINGPLIVTYLFSCPFLESIGISMSTMEFYDEICSV